MTRPTALRPAPLLVHVVCPPGRGGLAADRRILQDALRAIGHRCLDFPHAGHGPASKRFRLHRVLHPSLWMRRPDVNVFLEQIDPAWVPMARRQVLVPNPEWLREPCEALLPRMDLVLCKTRDAERIFGALGCRTARMGFTSRDLPGACARQPLPGLAHYADPRPLHVAGSSHAKGSVALLDAWRRHPEWPVLTVVARPAVLERLGGLPPNVMAIDRYLPQPELDRLMAEHDLHLCPSEAEGWGHSIVEAMGCAATVLCTDAPPMNELVQSDRGVLVPAQAGEPMRLGRRYRVDAAAVETAVLGLLALGAAGRMALGHAARRWFEQNDRAFRAALTADFAAGGPVAGGALRGSAPR